MGHSTRCIFDSLLRNFNCSKANHLIPAQSAHCLFNIRNSNKLSIQCASCILHIDTWHTDSSIYHAPTIQTEPRRIVPRTARTHFSFPALRPYCDVSLINFDMSHIFFDSYLQWAFLWVCGNGVCFSTCSNSGCVCVAVFYLLRTSASQCVISTSLPRTQTTTIEHVCIPYFELICRSFKFVWSEHWTANERSSKIYRLHYEQMPFE